jgi:hypothetical protein
MTKECIPQDAKDFVNRIVPDKFKNNKKYVSDSGRILINDEYTTPDKILKEDPYFEEFRMKTRNNEKISNKQIDNKLFIKMKNIKINNDETVNIKKKINDKKNKLISEKIFNDKKEKRKEIYIPEYNNSNDELSDEIDIIKMLKGKGKKKTTQIKKYRDRTISDDIRKLDPDVILNMSG